MLQILKDIDLSKVTQPDAFALKSIEKPLLPKVIKRWHKDLIHSHLNFNIDSDTDVDFLFFRSLVRDDYEELEDEIACTVHDYKSFFIRNYKLNSHNINIDILNLIIKYRDLLKIIDEENIWIKLGLFFRLIWYVYVLNRVLMLDFKVFVAFADMQPTENLIVQALHLCRPNVRTVTLQHGLYVDYEGLRTVNEVNYKSHVANIFLAWGLDTKRLIEKYHRDASVLVCGKPSIAGLPNVSKYHNDNSFKLDLLVVTDQKIFQEQNEILARLAFEASEKLGVNVYIRFHPSNNKNIILERYNKFIELKSINNKYIVLGHTTSLLYEAFTLGYPSLRLRSKAHHIPFPSEYEFSNTQELIDKVCAFKNVKNILSKNYISEVGEASRRLYRKAFVDMIN